MDHEPKQKNGPACPGCPIQDCPAGEGRDGLPSSGWRLGLAAMGLFLGPCVLAIAGAAYFAGSRDAQLLGAVAGLGIGMIGSVLVVRLLRRANKDESAKKNG